MPIVQSRRQFLTSLSLASAAGFAGALPLQAAEGSPETTSVSIVKMLGDCRAPIYVAEQLLRAEGFTDVRYVDTPLNALLETLASGKADFGLAFAPDAVTVIDHGVPVTVLSGVHVGCIEL